MDGGTFVRHLGIPDAARVRVATRVDAARRCRAGCRSRPGETRSARMRRASAPSGDSSTGDGDAAAAVAQDPPDAASSRGARARACGDREGWDRGRRVSGDGELANAGGAQEGVQPPERSHARGTLSAGARARSCDLCAGRAPADVPSRLSTVMCGFSPARTTRSRRAGRRCRRRDGRGGRWARRSFELMPCMRRRTNAAGRGRRTRRGRDGRRRKRRRQRREGGPPPSLPPAGLPTGAPVPNPVRSLEGMRAAAAATHVEPTSPRGAIRPKPVPKDLPACREISRMDEIIELHGECVARWHAGVRGFGTRIFTHKDCAEHAANTCCCAYEREVTTRKLRGARDALHEASAKMLLWQSRMAAAARLRHLRKRGYPAFRAWRNRSSGTAPQRKVLAMAVKVGPSASWQRHTRGGGRRVGTDVELGTCCRLRWRVRIGGGSRAGATPPTPPRASPASPTGSSAGSRAPSWRPRSTRGARGLGSSSRFGAARF